MQCPATLLPQDCIITSNNMSHPWCLLDCPSLPTHLALVRDSLVRQTKAEGLKYDIVA